LHDAALFSVSTGVDKDHIEELDDLLRRNKKVNQGYKERECGLYFASHGSSGLIKGLEPELVARALIILNKKREPPVFTKIVFDVCKAATRIDEPTQLQSSNKTEGQS
jgi:hypothetical protein